LKLKNKDFKMDYSKFSNILAVDLGYGDVKIAVTKEDGNMLITKFPSAIAKINPKKFGKGDAIEFEGDHYLVGEPALNYKPIEINDYETLEYYAPLFLYYIFKKFGEFSTIVTGLSIRQQQNADSFKERLSNFVVNGIEYNVDVKLLPQGIGAKLVAEKKFEGIKNYLVFDGGFNTIDLVPVFDNKADIHSVDAIENRGVIEVINELIDVISNEYNIELSPKEAKQILDTKQFDLYGKIVDMNETIDHIVDEYTRDLMKQIERKFKKSWHKFQKILVVGGLSHFINEKAYEHLVVVENGEFYNVIGFYRYGLEKIPNDIKTPKIKRSLKGL
jgi:hypothetical protein